MAIGLWLSTNCTSRGGSGSLLPTTIALTESRDLPDRRRISALKKLINDPNEVALETVQGFALAYPQYVRQLAGFTVCGSRSNLRRGKSCDFDGWRQRSRTDVPRIRGAGHGRCQCSWQYLRLPPPTPIYETAKAVPWGSRCFVSVRELFWRCSEFRHGALDAPGRMASALRLCAWPTILLLLLGAAGRSGVA